MSDPGSPWSGFSSMNSDLYRWNMLSESNSMCVSSCAAVWDRFGCCPEADGPPSGAGVSPGPVAWDVWFCCMPADWVFDR